MAYITTVLNLPDIPSKIFTVAIGDWHAIMYIIVDVQMVFRTILINVYICY
jgi:predicted phage gp36 major capsid-like protein